ncbi:MAG: hypothetical protein ACUVRM_11145, partial [Bacillota bacterium]
LSLFFLVLTRVSSRIQVNDSGDRVIGDYFKKPAHDLAPTRLAFFLFFIFIDFKRPLITPFGHVHLPKPTPMPERLKKIIKFEEPY